LGLRPSQTALEYLLAGGGHAATPDGVLRPSAAAPKEVRRVMAPLIGGVNPLAVQTV
jgi:hypothetical protein